MKRVLLLLLITPVLFHAQTNTFPASGNVGIGVSNPAYTLDIRGDQPILDLLENTSGGRRRLQLNVGTAREVRFISTYGTGGNYPFTFRFGGSVGEVMRINTNGNVGIGITNPKEKVHIKGNLRLGEVAEVKISPNKDVSSLNPGVTTLAASITGRKWGHFVVDIYGNDGKDAFAVRTDSNRDGVLDNIPFLVNNVGIGTISPGSWKLAVNGEMRAKEIKVETGWSDFVFKKDYNLPTLKEVEQHIQEKGHLKDIPSAKEVEKNGIYLGEMDAKLLQKIEELMLYTIQQEKRIKKLESKITHLEKTK